MKIKTALIMSFLSGIYCYFIQNSIKIFGSPHYFDSIQYNACFLKNPFFRISSYVSGSSTTFSKSFPPFSAVAPSSSEKLTVFSVLMPDGSERLTMVSKSLTMFRERLTTLSKSFTTPSEWFTMFREWLTTSSERLTGSSEHKKQSPLCVNIDSKTSSISIYNPLKKTNLILILYTKFYE